MRRDRIRKLGRWCDQGVRYDWIFAFKSVASDAIFTLVWVGLHKGEDLFVARRRKTAAERVRLALEPSDRSPVYDPSKPDPRLVALIRLLARKAAKEFVDTEWERAARDRLPD
jgi:hypothetical protein